MIEGHTISREQNDTSKLNMFYCMYLCIVSLQNCVCDAPNPHNKQDYDGPLGVI